MKAVKIGVIQTWPFSGGPFGKGYYFDTLECQLVEGFLHDRSGIPRQFIDTVDGCRSLRGFPLDDSAIPQHYIALPAFSMAHVRQMFLRMELDQAVIKNYDIDTFPDFPLEREQKSRELEGKYISSVHRYCEDNQLEESFWDFFQVYTLPIAIDWCEKTGTPYQLDDKK